MAAMSTSTPVLGSTTIHFHLPKFSHLVRLYLNSNEEYSRPVDSYCFPTADVVWSEIVYWSDPTTASHIRRLNKTVAASTSPKDLIGCFKRTCDGIGEPMIRQRYWLECLSRVIDNHDNKLLELLNFQTFDPSDYKLCTKLIVTT